MKLLPLHLLSEFYHVIFINRVHFFKPVNGVFHPCFPLAYFSGLIMLYFLWSKTALYLMGKGNYFLHCHLIWHLQCLLFCENIWFHSNKNIFLLFEKKYHKKFTQEPENAIIRFILNIIVPSKVRIFTTTKRFPQS